MGIRDMTSKQFLAALKRHNMKFTGVLGYVELGIPGNSISVSVLNAGKNHRAQLAYLLKRRKEWEEKIEKELSCLPAN